MRSSKASVMALAVLGCQSVLDVEHYSFVRADGSDAGIGSSLPPPRERPSPVDAANPVTFPPAVGTVIPGGEEVNVRPPPPLETDAPDASPPGESGVPRPIVIDG